jgi:LytR cell envelope-related transcriptional attenuator
VRPGPTVRAALVLAAFLALFLAVDRIGGGRPAGGGPLARAGDTTAPPSTAPASTTTTTTTTAPPTTRAPTTSVPGTSVSTLRPSKGVTVQVLNGVFVTGLAHRVADRLRAAGYQVVATNTALGNYRVSRIYYTEGHQADAVALRARFPVFQQIAPAPANLSRRVDLHVVVGKNYL